MADFGIKRSILALVAAGALVAGTLDAVLPAEDPKPVLNKQKISLEVPTGFRDSYTEKWREISEFIIKSDFSVYVINIKGYGGRVTYAHEFFKTIKEAQKQGKKIIFNLTGPVHSMHAYAVCYGDKVIKNGYYLMFHADRYTDDTGETYRTTPKNSTIGNDIKECQEKGVVSVLNMNIMWKGYEVYIFEDGSAKYIKDDAIPDTWTMGV